MIPALASTREPSSSTIVEPAAARGALAALLAAGALLCTPIRAITQAEIDALRQRINAPDVDENAAVIAAGMVLRSGPGLLTLRTGRIYPAQPVAIDGPGPAVAREYVFVGEGTLEIAPRDPIEARQLEIFAGSRQMREPIGAAVLVVANDDAAAAIARRPAVESVERAMRDRAQDLLAAWRASPERQILAVEEAVVADVLGESGAANFFAGAFEGRTRGRFLLSVEPRASEQVAMGAFEPYDLTEKERRKIGRMVHREQRRGRLLGVSADNLGRWDSWLSMPLERDGTKVEGAASFEPTHYQIEARIADGGDAIDGRARVRLRAAADGSRVATFDLLPDLLVSAALEGGGAPAPFLQSEGRISVVLGTAASAGESVEIELRWAGQAFDQTGAPGARSFHLRDTLSWYPHAGEEDLATYDVLLRWPRKWELLAVGDLEDEGADGELRWQRRTVKRPTLGYTFQFGQFEELTARVGEIDLTVAIDAASKALLDGRALLDAATDTVLYLTGVFGPLPSERLIVLTSQQDFSQSMFGFVTLSSEMTRDDYSYAELGALDPRGTIAHEISHQWWGHQVAWRSYRDQWLSEALADYSAALYLREHRSERAEVWNGPLTGWKDYLADYAANGQTIESLGPVVLGERLESSLSEAAYQLIVYTKGALVLNVLAQRVGAEAFHQVLRRLATESAGRPLATAGFLDLVASATQLDLDAFAEAFVYGTGVPEIEYSYRGANPGAAPGDQRGDSVAVGASRGVGTWRATLEVERTAPVRFSYRVARRQDGNLDVVRDAQLEPQPAQPPALAVPFEVHLRDAGDRGSPRRSTLDAPAARQRGRGTVLLEGVRSRVEVDLPAEPDTLILDPDEILLADFIDVTQPDPLDLLRRGHRALAQVDRPTAEERFREALTAELPPAAGLDDIDAMVERGTAEIAAVTAGLELARLELDRGDDAAAATWIDAAKARLKKAAPFLRSSMDLELLLVESRLDLRRGNARAVARRLSKAWDDWLLDGEALLLLAIAAGKAGETDLFADAVAAARRRTAEITDLSSLLAPM